MPSLQQTSFKDFPSPDIARSLTGPDILQKHSINSLLLEHNEIISRGLPSPIEDNMSLSDLLGGSQSSSPTSLSSSLVTNSSCSSAKGGTSLHHHSHHHLQQQPQQHHLSHHPTLGSFSSLASSLGGNGVGATVCEDSACSILSSTGGNSTGGGSSSSGGSASGGGSSGSVASNPFHFASLRIPSPSLNSPDLLTTTTGGLIGGGAIGSNHSTASNSSASSSSSSGISCGGGSGQSPTTHSFFSSLLQSTAGGGCGDGTSSSTGVCGYDEFRFDNDLMLGGASGGLGTSNGLTTETLKLRRRNISFDCSSPTTGTSTPGEGTPPSLTLCTTRNYRTGGVSHLQQASNQQHQPSVVQYDHGSSSATSNNGGGFEQSHTATSSGGRSSNSLSLFGTGNGSLSRADSPPDHTDTSNLLTSLETTSILDMLNYLTLSQSTTTGHGLAQSQQQQHHNSTQHQSQQQQQQSHQNQFSPFSTLSSLFQQQQQQQQQQTTAGSGSTAFGTVGGVGLSGLGLGNGFPNDYERLQNLQALNTLRLLQQSQQLSQLQQFQFNQSLLPTTNTGGGGGLYTGGGGTNAAGASGTTNGGLNVVSSAGSNSSTGSNNTNTMQLKGWSTQQQHHHQQHQQQQQQHQHQHQQHQQQQQLHQLSQHHQQQSSSSPSLMNGASSAGIGYSDLNLDRIARFHRSSAAHYDATCTWSGVLPPRSNRLVTYSSKIFLGGMPWDISEQSLVQIFKPFGSIKVEWPGKEQQATQPKGYVYIIFESDKQVKGLLQACTYTIPNGGGGGGGALGGGAGAGNYGSNRTGMHGASSTVAFSNFGCNGNDAPSAQHQQHQLVPMSNLNKPLAPPGAKINFKISSKRIKSKDVEVIPWNIADSNFVKSTSQKLDPTKTVFVGALHGQLTAEGLAKIMNDLFDGVVYVGIDTDKYKYPLGSARVTFNNARSYMKAVVAAFIEIRTSKFTKKLQVDPYLEDSLCSTCTVQHGPYFCREIVCFRYFCRSCWQYQHSQEVYMQNHKPLTRNSKFTAIIGVGPQQQQHHQQPSQGATGGGILTNNNNHHQQNSYDHSPYYNNHHHHHHHHGGGSNHSVGPQSIAGLSSHNQYQQNSSNTSHPSGGHHHSNNNNHQHHQQQLQGNRLGALQQQYHRALSKSPSPPMCNGNGSSTSINGSTAGSSSNSSSPISASNSCSSTSPSSSSSSFSASAGSISGNANQIIGNSAVGMADSSSHISCSGALNLHPHFIGGGSNGGGGGSGTGSAGGGGLLI